MSYLLPHLHSGYAVDQAILGEEDRVVVIRFGHDWDPQCMQVGAQKPALRVCAACALGSQLRPQQQAFTAAKAAMAAIAAAASQVRGRVNTP